MSARQREWEQYGLAKKKEKTRDVWESQREESKQVRINDTQTGFFPLFGGRRKERSEPHRREYSSLWKSNDECQKKRVVERLKSAHHEKCI